METTDTGFPDTSELTKALPELINLAKEIEARLTNNPATAELVPMAETIIHMTSSWGLVPFAQAHGPQGLWSAGVTLSDYNGFRSLGLLMQIKALHETDGMGEAILKILEEKLLGVGEA